MTQTGAAKLIVCTPSEGASDSLCGPGFVASFVDYVPDALNFELIATGAGLMLLAYTLGIVISPIMMLTENDR